MSTESIIFQIGAITFALASFYFLLSGKNKPNFSTEFFVSFITTTSYALMGQNIATRVSLSGDTIYWSRWLFYMIACSILMYDAIKILKIPDGEFPKFAILTWLTMFNGFLSSYIITPSKWLFYILSSAAFIGLLYNLLKGKDNPDFKTIKQFILVGWTLFPIVFLLSPTGLGIINPAIAESSYLVLDIVTKIIFGLKTSSLK
jgi:sensory rhodopsin